MPSIAKNKLPELLAALAAGREVYVPASVEGVKRFLPWRDGLNIELEGPNALLAPRDLFFPQSEIMYRYREDGQELSIEEAAVNRGRQVIFGLRACDLKAIDCLDDVFLTKTFVDKFYAERRRDTLLVVMGCLKPGPTCFCDSMGVVRAEPSGADAVLWPSGDRYLLEAKSEAGKELLNSLGKLLQQEEVSRPEPVPCTLRVEVEGLPDKLAGMFEHPLWADFCRKCLNCGICTYLCPTCQCFDIQGENRGQDGHKFRCWDSCMFAEYTQMAGGHNPRPTKKERVRNRFLHKLQYFPERYGKFGCVGCGRCLKKCPVNVDITRLITTIREVKADAV